MKTLVKLLAVVVVLLYTASAAPPVFAGCVCTGGGWTSTRTGYGPTCGDAREDILNQVATEIGTACDPGVAFCGLTFVRTIACSTLWNGSKTVTGYYTYGCYVCDGNPDPF